MSVSRDDFSIAFRSALLQRGASQKFSVLSLIFLALIIFFLDVYGVKFTKPVRSFLNDVVYRVTFLASTHAYPGGDQEHETLLGDDEKKTPLDKSWKDRASAPVSGVRSAWP